MFYRKPFPLCTLLLLALVLGACKDKPTAAAATVLLRVDSRTVTLEDFKRDFAKSLPPNQQLSAEERSELERSYLVQTIDRQLALAEGQKLGITVTPQELEAALEEHRRDYPAGGFEQSLLERGITIEQWRQELEERLIMEKVARQVVYTRVEVADTEIDRYFRENRQEFDRPAQVRARQIVVSSETEGERILGLLRAGGSFENLAKEFSLSPDADDGGDLGFFGRGEMPAEFDATVFNLAIGRLSPLIKSEYGYHIFRVDEKREAVRLTLEQVREEIRDKLRAEKEEAAYEKWLQELRSRASIDVKWSLL
jgi:peptidyl-prolyl cis-trans isomerase C